VARGTHRAEPERGICRLSLIIEVSKLGAWLILREPKRERLVMDAASWLRSLGLEQYEAAFRDNAIRKKSCPA
jgi:SAM domain (Sterile alpha motif)